MRPKDIGTRAESLVRDYLRANGFPGADRQPLRGTADQGDIAVCPGFIAEVKAGVAAETASDAQVAWWLAEAERERQHAGAEIGVLVLKRKGKGQPRDWWAVLPWGPYGTPMRMRLDDLITKLRHDGWGEPL